MRGPLSAAAADEFRTGWPVVLASTIGFALGSSGLVFYTSSVFITALRQEFHWSMAGLQSGFLVTGLLALVTSPVAGWLVDRFGTRRIAIPSMVAFGVCFMAMSLQDGRYTTFLMLWALLSITGAGTLSLVWSRAVSGWFDAGRGTALGVTLMGTGITAMLAPPLTAYLIHLGGWRFAYRALGAGAICISSPLLLLFLRDKTQGDPQTVPQRGVDVGRALSHWRFWVIGFALFGVTTVVSGLISNLFKLLTSQGYTSAHAATVAGLVGLFVIVGRASCGLLMDRFNPQVVGAAFFTGPPLACILLNVSNGSTVALLAAALIGLGAAAEFDVIPILLCRYFGIVRLGSILGLAMIFFSVGAALGPIAFGHVFDVYGDYRLALWLGAALSASAATALLTLGRVSPDGTEPQSMESATPFDLGTLNQP